jgi:hypothetical protein
VGGRADTMKLDTGALHAPCVSSEAASRATRQQSRIVRLDRVGGDEPA